MKNIEELFKHLQMDVKHAEKFHQEEIDYQALLVVPNEQIEKLLPIGPKSKLIAYLDKVRNNPQLADQLLQDWPTQHNNSHRGINSVPPPDISMHQQSPRSNGSVDSPPVRLMYQHGAPHRAQHPVHHGGQHRASHHQGQHQVHHHQQHQLPRRSREYAARQISPDEQAMLAMFPLLTTRPANTYFQPQPSSRIIGGARSSSDGRSHANSSSTNQDPPIDQDNRSSVPNHTDKNACRKQNDLLVLLRAEVEQAHTTNTSTFAKLMNLTPKISRDLVAKFLLYSMLRKFFRKFLSLKHKCELMMFWKECRKYRTVPNAHIALKVRSDQIIKTYLTRGTQKLVNLNKITLQNIERRKDNPEINMFDEAQDEVVGTIVPLFGEFVNTELFRQYTQEVENGLHAQEVEHDVANPQYQVKQQLPKPVFNAQVTPSRPNVYTGKCTEKVNKDQASVWTPNDVMTWLKCLNLGERQNEILENFYKNGISGDVLLNLDQTTLQRLVPTQHLDHITAAIQDLKDRLKSPVNNTGVFLQMKHLADVTRLSEGFFGETFKATWSRPGSAPEDIVVKISKKGAGGMEWNELAALKNIPTQPNFLRLIGLMTDFCPPNSNSGQMTVAIVVPWINNGTLREFIDNSNAGKAHTIRPLPAKTSIKFAYHMARGIAHMHANGYLHRDIAARNYLLDKDHSNEITVVLSDFGLALPIGHDQDAFQPRNEEGSIIIPWPFCAPETLESYNSSVETDVWMFGVALWQLACAGTGVEAEPFYHLQHTVGDAEDLVMEFDVLMKNRGQPVPLKWPSQQKKYVPQIRQIVEDCCQFDKSTRPTMAHVEKQLERIWKNPVLPYDKGHGPIVFREPSPKDTTKYEQGLQDLVVRVGDDHSDHSSTSAGPQQHTPEHGRHYWDEHDPLVSRFDEEEKVGYPASVSAVSDDSDVTRRGVPPAVHSSRSHGHSPHSHAHSPRSHAHSAPSHARSALPHAHSAPSHAHPAHSRTHSASSQPHSPPSQTRSPHPHDHSPHSHGRSPATRPRSPRNSYPSNTPHMSANQPQPSRFNGSTYQPKGCVITFTGNSIPESHAPTSQGIGSARPATGRTLSNIGSHSSPPSRARGSTHSPESLAIRLPNSSQHAPPEQKHFYATVDVANHPNPHEMSHNSRAANLQRSMSPPIGDASPKRPRSRRRTNKKRSHPTRAQTSPAQTSPSSQNGGQRNPRSISVPHYGEVRVVSQQTQSRATPQQLTPLILPKQSRQFQQSSDVHGFSKRITTTPQNSYNPPYSTKRESAQDRTQKKTKKSHSKKHSKNKLMLTLTNVFSRDRKKSK